MGVTLESKYKAIDLGCGGFSSLRTKVAELTNKELWEHYKYLDKGMFLQGDERTKFFDDYDKKANDIIIRNEIPDSIASFLYQSDCGGKLSVRECRELYRVIKNYDDDIIYGYFGRPDGAMFKDFKEVIKSCVKKRVILRWW